jgi:predicted PurR-regulated permease PerM
VTADYDGPSIDPIPVLGSPTEPTSRRIDLDPRSAIPIAIAFAILAVSIWLVRAIPRTLALTAIASLISFALLPVVEALRRRTGWKRRYAAATVLVGTGVIAITTLVLVLVPTINQVRAFNKDVPKTVDQLGTLPIIGPRLREANASKKVRQWLDNFPKRLDVNSTPIANAASAIADGVAATLFALLLAITLVLDGERIVTMARRLIPERRRPDADRLGRLIYNVVGRYIAGTMFMAALAGVVILVASLSLGVPLAPLLAVWVAICNPIPQIGGFLGAVPFVALGLTVSGVVGVICLIVFLIYQQTENHILQPLIIGRAVHLTPPATMVAALIGVAAGGVIGGLLAIPMLGASKAIYLAFSSTDLEVPPSNWVPPSEHLPSSQAG